MAKVEELKAAELERLQRIDKQTDAVTEGTLFEVAIGKEFSKAIGLLAGQHRMRVARAASELYDDKYDTDMRVVLYKRRTHTLNTAILNNRHANRLSTAEMLANPAFVKAVVDDSNEDSGIK